MGQYLQAHKWFAYWCIGLEHQGEKPADWPKDKPYTPHLQGYVQTSKKARWGGFQLLCPGGGWSKKRKKADKDGEWSEIEHWQAIHWMNKHRDSTPTEARNYCKKEGDWEEFGTFTPAKGPGHRSDLDELAVMIKIPGMTKLEIADKLTKTYIRQRTNIIATLGDFAEGIYKPRSTLEVIVLWGPTGTGKTHMTGAYDNNPDIYVIHGADLKNKWWPLYNSQTTLVIDDWQPSHCKLGKMLKITDKVKGSIQIKNGSRLMRWETVFITTNSEWPNHIYTGVEQGRRLAFFRRVTQVHHVFTPWKDRTPIVFSQFGLEGGIPQLESSQEEGDEIGPRPRLVRQFAMVFDRDEE